MFNVSDLFSSTSATTGTSDGKYGLSDDNQQQFNKQVREHALHIWIQSVFRSIRLQK